jgi:Domain of unknown function (DUF1851)
VDIHDYLIDQAGQDWPTLLEAWGSVLPASFTLWLVNRLGDVFFIAEDGSVYVLDVGTGRVRRLAESRTQFSEQMDIPGNANHWLMIPLVDRCVSAGLRLASGQCYAFKVPPILGGKYSVENIWVNGLAPNYSFLASFHDQIKHVPDGTRVKIIVK